MKKRIGISLIAASMALGVSAGAFFNSHEKALTKTEAASVSIDDYYSQCEGLSGSSLQSKLLSINSPKSKSYDWSRYEAADEALDDSTSILSLYTRHNIKKSSHCGSYSWSTWNREHIWTQSKYPKSDTDNHNIFACEGQINNYRGNYPFAEVSHTAGNTKQIFGHDTGCYWTNSAFEPCDEAKGEVARSVMYGTVMYSYTMTEEIASYELALKWHLEHPITERDIKRNDKVYELQGNRNPFVDHPEYACKIWGNTNDKTKQICGSQQVTLSSIILGGNYKTSFEVNDSFTYSGLVVTAHYTDGSSKTVTPTSVSTPSMSSAGTKTVTVSYTDGGTTKTATYTIEVTSGGVLPESHTTGLSLDKTSLNLTVGGTATLVATKIPSDSVDPVTWSSSNTSVATVSNGTVTAVSSGSAVITATSNGINAICNVSVSKPSTENITITTSDVPKSSYPKSEIQFEQGGSTFNNYYVSDYGTGLQFKGSNGYISNKTPIDIESVELVAQSGKSFNGKIYWGTSQNPTTNEAAAANNSILSNPGNYQYFKLLNGGSASYLSEIIIHIRKSEPQVYDLSLDKTSLSFDLYNDSDSKELSATVQADVGADKTITWTSDNTNVATVVNGIVTPVGVGSAVITATVGNLVASCAVTVSDSTPVSVSSVSLNKESLSLTVGDSETLSATVLPSNAANKSVTWTSSNESVVTVSNGLVSAVGAGTATVIVKTVDGDKTAICEVTVANQVVHVSCISFANTEANILVGGTDLTLIPIIEPSDATNKNVSWNSTDDSVASVNNGVVHALKNGTTVIKATTEDGGKVAQCTVTVTTSEVFVNVTDVTLNKTSAQLEVGEKTSLSATVSPSDATNQNISWSSSDETVAKVSNGLVTALSAGTARITVTTEDGGLTASCDVTVTQYIPPTPVDDKVMTELVITSYPDKTVYTVGEEFDKTGLKVEVNYLDGTSKEVDDIFVTGIKKSVAGLQTASVVYNELGKNVRTSFDVLYLEAEATIVSISKASNFAKTEYYVGDELLLLGLKVNGTLSDGSVVDVTDLVDISCDLSSVGSKEVTISLGDVDPIVTNVTVKEGEPTSQEEAMDFVYEYEYKVSEVTEDVTKAQWLVLEHYYNTLDEDAKNVLKSVVTEYSSGVSAGNDNKINEIIKNYDEVIIAKKASGFNDFMGRNPKAVEPANNNTISITTIIVIAAIAVVVIGFCIILPIIIKSKAKKRA